MVDIGSRTSVSIDADVWHDKLVDEHHHEKVTGVKQFCLAEGVTICGEPDEPGAPPWR